MHQAHTHLYELACGRGDVSASVIARQFRFSRDCVDEQRILEETKKFASDTDALLWAMLDIVFWEWPVLLARILNPKLTFVEQLQAFQDFLDASPCDVDANIGQQLQKITSLDDFIEVALPIIRNFCNNTLVTNMKLERALKRITTARVRRSCCFLLYCRTFKLFGVWRLYIHIYVKKFDCVCITLNSHNANIKQTLGEGRCKYD